MSNINICSIILATGLAPARDSNSHNRLRVACLLNSTTLACIVPMTGLGPVRPFGHGILSAGCLPNSTTSA